MRMKTLGRKLFLALVFLLITLVIAVGVDFALTDDVHAYSRVMLDEFYSEAGTIDTVFVGSSHCYRSFDPALADELLEENTFNLGTSQQLPDGSYHLIREAGQAGGIKTVYLECFYPGYIQQSSKNVPLACYLITDYLRPSLNKYSYLWEMGGPAALVDDFLPARHSIASPGELISLWKAKLTDGYTPGNYAYVTYPNDEEYRGKGFVYTYGTPPYGFGGIADVDAAQPISDFAQEYLQKIIAYCKTQNIRLVLVVAPLPSAFAANTKNYQAYIDAMQALADKNKLSYWDFTLYRDGATLDLTSDDFSDAHHLNGMGAEKFTRVFCEVAAKAEAGEDVSRAFYETLEEKLTASPDATYSER